MKPIGITSLYLTRPLKVGRQQADFIKGEHYKMTLVDGVKIRIECRTTGDVTWTTVFSVLGWKQAEAAAEGQEAEPAAAKKPAKKAKEAA